MARLALVAVLSVGFLLASTGKVQALGLPAGAQAPPWSLEDGEGNTFNFPEDLEGKPAIVLFWATWCPYCKSLMPWLNQLRAEFREQDVRVLALNFREDGDPEAYLAEQGYDFVHFPLADDVAASFAVRFTPGLFVVDSRGVVLYNRYDDNEVPEVPNEGQASHSQKAAVRAPHWARQARFYLQQALEAGSSAAE